ncbi:uncharacterized protein ARMOST_19913 [Armillaria ostoyae]|uniref:Uncharacterized protein n=1 Tax=Armillaria ostoyae TaxID=47428 RepID=A0A284S5W2_ARMOS|nr:uncharacterized protein ARMOST_19913 [Armillaria ostoyae]
MFTGISGEPNTTINTEWMKVEEVLGKIQAVGWTIRDFLFHLSKVKDDHGNGVKGRSQTHAAMLSSFLGEKCSYTVSDIIEAWVQSPMGVLKKDNPERDNMFSVNKHFWEIKSARPGITSLAAQLVKEHLVKTMDMAVEEDGGLHMFMTGAWEIIDDFGSETLQTTITIVMPAACLSM